ncbi:AAA family ATPase [Jeotgalibacillus aurantiacus]|uniref:AAA family ATPase n=1 Tax=Jeotgalibacillus aurantiacus TaxID=2763266 RepID=UPI001D0A7634|nr:ATP-binding protein [Jeotgalibacillus aurantiacus]
MLLEFTVENFRSIKNKITFSMIGSSSQKHPENYFLYKNSPILKSTVVYGANGSGKSNFIQALKHASMMIKHSRSFVNMKRKPMAPPFHLDQNCLELPTTFEFVFAIEDIIYRFGFSVKGTIITDEWLYTKNSSRETMQYERKDNQYRLGREFKEGRGLDEKTAESVLFLTVVSELNGELSRRILDWFNKLNILTNDRESSLFQLSAEILHDRPDISSVIIDFMNNADVGIDGLSARKIEDKEIPEFFPDEVRESMMNDYVVYSEHRVRQKDGTIKNKKFNFSEVESEGTKKLFSLSAMVISTLHIGGVLILDELDAKLHPLLTRYIVQLFNSEENNPENAQLIFTTHDTGFLSNRFFRKDQIWFTEKSEDGGTDLYSLEDLETEDGQKIRSDAPFEKDYIQGKYGAIPYVNHSVREVPDGF